MRGKIGVKYASVALEKRRCIELGLIIHTDVDGKKIANEYLVTKGYNMVY